jgi:tetratricopeptide (TPR) repeat protein
MNVRLLATPILSFLLAHCASGQTVPQGAGQSSPPADVRANTGDAIKQKFLRGIAQAETAVKQAEAAHANNVTLSKAYTQLGLWCQNLAQWDRSEAALEHAVALLRQPAGPGSDLATAIGQLASLHVTIGKLRESEKESLEALKITLDLGDTLLIARSQDDLAILYLAKKKYEKARDMARLAEAEFVRNGRADVLDRVTARITLSESLCNLKDCPSAIPLLKAALEEARASMSPEDFPIGLSDFLLGYAYWKSGNIGGAEQYLAQGTTEMDRQLGWGHPAYLKALKCYAEFLHEDRQVEAANAVERRIRQAEAVVDVHSIQTAFDGLR